MKKIALILSLIFLFACGENKNSFNVETEKTAILEVMKTQQTGWNQGNWEMYMSGYKNSEKIRFAGKGKITYGWKTVLENYKKSYPDKSSMGILTFSEQDVKILSPNSAFVFGKWHLKRETDEPHGLYTLLWEKTEQGWKIIHDHSSSAE